MRYKIFWYKPADKYKHRVLSAKELKKEGGFLPGQHYKNSFKVFDKGWRKITADAILYNDLGKPPDILCLQEVENMDALRRFNEDYLKKSYKYAYLMDARDPRRIDVGILSNYNVKSFSTHMYDLNKFKNVDRKYVFSRDCLVVTFQITKEKELTIFINHLKSKFSETKAQLEKGNLIRRNQSSMVARLVRKKFKKNFNTANFVVLGDFNDTPNSPHVRPLVKNLGLFDVMTRLNKDERWTHWWEVNNVLTQIDYILLSPKLAKNSKGKPYVERGGLSEYRMHAYLNKRKSDAF